MPKDFNSIETFKYSTNSIFITKNSLYVGFHPLEIPKVIKPYIRFI